MRIRFAALLLAGVACAAAIAAEPGARPVSRPATASSGPTEVLIETSVVRLSRDAIDKLGFTKGLIPKMDITLPSLLMLMSDREAVQILATASGRVRPGKTLEMDVEMKEPMPTSHPAGGKPALAPVHRLRWKVKPTVAPNGITLDYSLARLRPAKLARKPAASKLPAGFGYSVAAVVTLIPGRPGMIGGGMDAEGGTFTVVRAEVVPLR